MKDIIERIDENLYKETDISSKMAKDIFSFVSKLKVDLEKNKLADLSEKKRAATKIDDLMDTLKNIRKGMGV